MNDLLKKLDLSIRLLESQNKSFIAEYIRTQRDTLEEIYRGKPYVLCTYYFPSELSSIFDAAFIYIERIAGLCAGLNLITDLDKSGLPDGTCSYQKAFLNLIENDILPKPAMIMAVRYPCKDAVLLCEHLRDKYNIPIKYISTKSLKEDLVSAYTLLNTAFPIKQDINRTIKLSNEASALKIEIDNYRKQYPAIINSDDCLKVFTVENDFGNENAVIVLNELLEYIKSKLGTYEEPEGIKIFWTGLIPLYNNSILSKAQRQLQCRFIYEEMWIFGEYKVSDSFFNDIASKIRKTLFFNNEQRARRLIETAKQMKASFVINFSQKNCSFLPGKFNCLKEEFNKNNIKILNITDDVIAGDYNENKLIELIKREIEC